MRSLLLATTFGVTAQALAVANKSKKPAVQALLESAASMLKNGATDDVVTFAEVTLGEVTGVVIPAILDESRNDQRFLDALHRRFKEIRDTLVSDNQDIIGLHAKEKELSDKHGWCRDQEHSLCYDDTTKYEPTRWPNFLLEQNPEVSPVTRIDKTGDLAIRNPIVEEGKAPIYWPASRVHASKRKCEMDMYSLWTTWVEEEQELLKIHGGEGMDNHHKGEHVLHGIEGQFCGPNANGTLDSFRQWVEPKMRMYMNQKTVVDAAEAAYDLHYPECVTAHGDLDFKSQDCNVLQEELELKTCEHALKITSVLNSYYDDFAQAQSAYSCAVEEIMQLESDRKKEWITLQVVDCLLTRIREQNGVPCDSAGQAEREVQTCERRHGLDPCSPMSEQWDEDVEELGLGFRGVNDTTVSRNSTVVVPMDNVTGQPVLCLNYRPVPPHPVRCEISSPLSYVGAFPIRTFQYDVAECLPVEPPAPCSTSWLAEHYDSLPLFPADPFSETNPGCNARPECSRCEAYGADQHKVEPKAPPGACPGYAIDTCDNSTNIVLHNFSSVHVDHEDHFIEKADVRCCSNNGTECKSEGFPGGCEAIQQVTHEAALEICHNANMRMCTTAEVDLCCDTGCYEAGNHIWVDLGGRDASLSTEAPATLTSTTRSPTTHD